MPTAWPPGLEKSKYVLLTTFTRDGRPKPTPLWFTRDGERLLVSTDRDAWKVKRVRNTPRVLVRACTARGRPTGPQVEAEARVLDGDAALAARGAVLRRYPVAGRLFRLGGRLARLRPGARPAAPAGIEVVLPRTG
ncbi:PPOX class F420-dependent oxidoreductase [Kineococcus sp. SYSU DK018]|uniref:PPOX class F420-dependent oxidoreductase n=1 Tax=Kineococcus sp. SYSU DK018 TaxID=3383139 RepID=UPI003D7DEADF